MVRRSWGPRSRKGEERRGRTQGIAGLDPERSTAAKITVL